MLILRMLALSAIFGFAGSMLASAQNSPKTQSLCNSLSRPNIDCICVNKKMDSFVAAAPNQKVIEVLQHGYAWHTGHDVNYTEIFSNWAKDEMARLEDVMVMERVGGMPEDIADYENGCVKDGVLPAQYEMPLQGSPKARYLRALLSWEPDGVTPAATNICQADLNDPLLSERDWLAKAIHMERISGSEGDFNKKTIAVKAEKMGMSVSDYRRLLKQIDKKLAPIATRNALYCEAMTWANHVTPEQNQRQQSEQSRLKEKSMSMVDSRTFTEGDDLTQASLIVETNCKANGQSDGYCQCTVRDFKDRIASQTSSQTALAFATINGMDGVPQDAMMKIMTSTPQANMQEAGGLLAQMAMASNELGSMCAKSSVATKTRILEGDPRERMLKICMAENDNQQLCECTTDQMRKKVSADNFELIVDIREAGFQGAEDPLAKVAADRGLSAKEAEDAMMMNRKLIGGMMSLDLMSCMGGLPAGMPDMSQMQEFPGNPQ